MCVVSTPLLHFVIEDDPRLNLMEKYVSRGKIRFISSKIVVISLSIERKSSPGHEEMNIFYCEFVAN